MLQGMEYLHRSPLESHGRLKSSNVLVDKRWVCRVSDFGLHRLREEDGASHHKVDNEETCYWTCE